MDYLKTTMVEKTPSDKLSVMERALYHTRRKLNTEGMRRS